MVEYPASAGVSGIGNQEMNRLKPLGLAGALSVIAFGIFLRLYAVTEPNFFVFDEGYYLKFNYRFVHAVDVRPPRSVGEFLKAASVLVSLSLGTGKPLWFLLVDARTFWGAAQQWYFPRVVSCLCGILTLVVSYLFAKKFYRSQAAALLTGVILSLLPSHIFYSRLALQEAMSGLFFLSGLYFYFFPQRFGGRAFISAICLTCSYLTNCRLIFIPFVIACIELFCYFVDREGKTWRDSLRKYMWHTLVFISLVLIIGSMDRGQNMRTIYAWTMHQSSLAKEHVDWFNFFSYPYYLFQLEGWLVGILFFANLYFVIRKQWYAGFPFLLFGLLMAIFSLTSDRAARYVCVGLPFLCMAVAGVIAYIFREEKERIPQKAVVVTTVLLLLSLLSKSLPIAFAKSDYKSSAAFLQRVDPNAKILSTQPWIQKLFVQNDDIVEEAPYGYRRLLERYVNGYRYLIIDPQSYISFTESGSKFDLKLKGALGLFDLQMRPVRVFSHFNAVILERFVFEHNESLKDSIAFLKQNRRRAGSLRIYDIKAYVDAMVKQSLQKPE